MTAPHEEVVTANGLRHHVLTWGRGPVDVVMCHGFLDIAWSFDQVATKLAERGHTVAAFDWRGHGETEWIGAGGYYHFADYVLDLDELLPQLSANPVHLVGHSMGGGACAMFAAARPTAIRTLCLIEGIGPPELEPRNAAKRITAWLDGVAQKRDKRGPPIADLGEAVKRMRVRNPELNDELGTFLADKSTTAAEGGLRWCFDPLHRTLGPRPFARSQFQEVLSAVAAPTLIVAGENGLRLPQESEYLQAIADHRLVEIAEVGHMIHWFEAERLASELESFFADRAP
ncbi:MAG: alpha/beta hydrolase [Myxococcota bacterium]